jgi:hypothetical protein
MVSLEVNNPIVQYLFWSRVTPSMQSQEVTLDMIEFPQRDTPLQIAVCPSTGNLIVAALNVMVIDAFFKLHFLM